MVKEKIYNIEDADSDFYVSSLNGALRKADS
jgi:hypothetical protein